MTKTLTRPSTSLVRCAIYTRKSSEEGLQQEFNSLDAQREAAEAYIASQQHEGWRCLPDAYDDGGYTGGNTERPALQRLMRDIEDGKVDCVIVYKVDRLSRSLLDFTKLMEVFDRHKIAFVSVTQQFNTASSMGRLVLNVLLSFAQFEREIIAERTRDKLAAMRKKGKWVGGLPPLGYDVDPASNKLVVNDAEATRVRAIFRLYRDTGSLLPTVAELRERGWLNKKTTSRQGRERGGQPFDRTSLHRLLTNVTYLGKVEYKDQLYDGEQPALVDNALFTEVQQLLNHNRTTGGAVVRNQHGAILKGLLHCAACDGAMTPTHTTKKNRRYRYYACVYAEKHGRERCPTKSVPAGTLEEFVIDHIRHVGRDEEVLRATIAQAEEQHRTTLRDLDAEIRQWEGTLHADHDTLRTLSGQYLARHHEGVLEQMAQLQRTTKQAEERLTRLRQQRDALAHARIDGADLRQALAQFDGVWESLTPREQAELVGLLIERIDYDGRDQTLAIQFHPHGLQTLAQTTAQATGQPTE